MRRVLKWVGIVLGALVGLVVLAVVGVLVYGQIAFKRTYNDRPLYPITADTSAEGIARGHHLVRITSCGECHAAATETGEPDVDGPLIGQVEAFSEGPFSGLFATPNLTPDEETGLGAWTDAEIARAIREGLDIDGVSLAVMPSFLYHDLSDADVAAIVGYLRSLEPVRNEIPPFELNALGKGLFSLGLVEPVNPREPIASPQLAPASGTAEYGAYLVTVTACRRCHGEDLAGGPVPFAEEGTPPAANLTPAGEVAGWSQADFIAAVRDGVTPTGRMLHPVMPRWPMTEEELADIFRYLQTLPPVRPE